MYTVMRNAYSVFKQLRNTHHAICSYGTNSGPLFTYF